MALGVIARRPPVSCGSIARCVPQLGASGIAGPMPPLSAVFADSDLDIWESRSPHTGLLWALELLCWSEDYVAEACDTLARLAEIDPGGRLANRPAASLRRVLLPWFPKRPLPGSRDCRLSKVCWTGEQPSVGISCWVYFRSISTALTRTTVQHFVIGRLIPPKQQCLKGLRRHTS